MLGLTLPKLLPLRREEPERCAQELAEIERVSRQMLREVWRVLAPSGRLMAVIPNRRGVWTRTDTTPFGHGRPFTRLPGAGGAPAGPRPAAPGHDRQESRAGPAR